MGQWSHRGRVGITLTKARTKSRRHPNPKSLGLCAITVRLSMGTQVLCSPWAGPRDTCGAALASLGGAPATPQCRPQERGPPLHSLDDSTLLPLEGGTRGWSGQQQLLLMNQAVQQIFLAVVVVNLQERQGGDRQPSQPRGPQTKLHGRQSSVSGGEGFIVLYTYLPALALQAREATLRPEAGQHLRAHVNTPIFGLFSAVTAMSNTYKDPGLH